MFSYGQYCPIAKSAEVLGDRWTLLIVRELIFNVHRFNELHRGLPGISRSVLVDRLRRLEETGVLERRGEGQDTTYFLTRAGEELEPVITVLGDWAARWVLSDPTPRDTDPDLLVLALVRHVHVDKLPERRVVVSIDLHPPPGVRRRRRSYWLVMERADVSLCLKPPGFDPDLIVTSDLISLSKVYMGRLCYDEAVRRGLIRLQGPRDLVRVFPTWMAWSHFAPTVRETERKRVAGKRAARRKGRIASGTGSRAGSSGRA